MKTAYEKPELMEFGNLTQLTGGQTLESPLNNNLT